MFNTRKNTKGRPKPSSVVCESTFKPWSSEPASVQVYGRPGRKCDRKMEENTTYRWKFCLSSLASKTIFFAPFCCCNYIWWLTYRVIQWHTQWWLQCSSSFLLIWQSCDTFVFCEQHLRESHWWNHPASISTFMKSQVKITSLNRC